MPDSPVVHALRSARLAMNAVDNEVTRSLGSRWLRLEAQLSGNISALSNEMTRRTQDGEIVTETMVMRSENYKTTRDQLRRETDRYNIDALKTISDGQHNAIRLGVDAAQNAIMISSPGTPFRQVNMKAIAAMIGIAGDGSPLMKLLRQSFGDSIRGIIRALLRGVARGLGADEVARLMRKAMGIGMDRALLIARTELNRAYRAASVETYRASGVVDGWMRLVARDEACAACIALDGERFNTADEMDDHPNGRCTCVPILSGMPPPQWEMAQDWFAKLSGDRQREILGPGRYDLYRNGTPLSRLVRKNHSDTWGDSPGLIPIGEIQ